VDYDAIKRLLADPDYLPDTFDVWLDATKKQIAELAAREIFTDKVVVNSEKFSSWSRASWLDQNIATLRAFAVSTVKYVL